MNGHKTIKCDSCGSIIAQCNCISHRKTFEYRTCSLCLKSGTKKTIKIKADDLISTFREEKGLIWVEIESDFLIGLLELAKLCELLTLDGSLSWSEWRRLQLTTIGLIREQLCKMKETL